MKSVSCPNLTSGMLHNQVRAYEERQKITDLLENDPSVQKALLAESRRIRELDEKASEVAIDTLILSVLHISFGFGRKRLLKFASEFYKVYNDYREYYADDVDDMIYAMMLHLERETGINVENLKEEIKAYENSDKG